MRRRTYLGVLASSIALAGCMGDGGDGGTTPTPTAEPTATPTPEPTPTVIETPTATPTPSEPVIERANMIHSTGPDDWIANNAIEAAGKGASVKFGFEYGLPAEQSRPEPRIDAKVRDEAGTVVASQEISAEIDASDTDYVETSGWIGVDMANQPLGTYTAEITIFDRFNRVASEPAAIEFDIVSPLEPPEVRLRSHGPETVSIGESFYLATTFENLSSRDSSIVDNLGYRQPDWNSTQRITQVSYEIPANGIARHRLGSLSFDEPTTLIFELSRMDVTWEIEVV